MTKKELSQLYYLNREIDEEKRKLAELEAAAEGGTAKITGMPHGTGGTNQVEQYAMEIAELREIISLKVRQSWHELNRLSRYINDIDDAQTRMIFSLRYINGLGWKQIANRIGGNTEDSVRKAHNRYLEKSKLSVLSGLDVLC